LTPRRLAAAALAALAIACAGMPGTTPRPVASSQFDATADFARYRTWAWRPGIRPLTGEPRVDNPFLHQRIENAVAAQLQARGLVQTTPAAADLLLVYRLALTEDFRPGALDAVEGYPQATAPGVRSLLFGRAVKRGSMVLDMIDAQRGTVVWRGLVEREVSSFQDPDAQLPAVQSSVRALLGEFPPPSVQRGE